MVEMRPVSSVSQLPYRFSSALARHLDESSRTIFFMNIVVFGICLFSLVDPREMMNVNL
jgi:hypothetical protein